MVFHTTNYMRETNVWMIRKMRWILWCTFGFIPFYRNVYWDYLGRRAAWYDSMFMGTEADKKAYWESMKGDWGYHPRYEAKLPFSIKTAKYANQTREEAIRDTPRVVSNENVLKRKGVMTFEEVNSIVMIAKEHNRIPGSFDYRYPQTFYSTYPQIDQESYITLGAGNAPGTSRRMHTGVESRVYN